MQIANAQSRNHVDMHAVKVVVRICIWLYSSGEVVQAVLLTLSLGGVVVSVFATGPKGCGFEPCQGDGFLRAIKIRSTPSFWVGSKAGDPVS
jgi:hypothetical protein